MVPVPGILAMHILGCAPLLVLTAPVAAQGQVHVVDDGPFDFGAVQMLDVRSDGTVESRAELGDLSPGLAGALRDGDGFGSAAAALGDLDDNGAVDLAAGAPGDDTGGDELGAVWILLRSPAGAIVDRRAIRAGEGLSAALGERAAFGSALVSVGDIDGDGRVELAVGAPGNALPDLPLDLALGPGEVRILSLEADGRVMHERRIGLGLGGFGGALADDDGFGGALAAIGDHDGDGVGDLAVGAPRDDDGGPDSGALWIVHLHPDSSVKSTVAISRTQGGLGTGVSSFDQFGSSLCSIGDVDGDGVGDLAVGARNASSGQGAVWILFANTDGTVRAKQKIDRTVGGLVNPSYSAFGAAIAPLGDRNGDGRPDLAVGASTSSAGAVFTLFLLANGTVGAQQRLEGTALGLVSGDRLGAAVVPLGDLDLDGRLDVAVGSSGREGVHTADFIDLQTAIDAAAPGDTLVVRGSTVGYGDATIAAKSLTLTGESPGPARVGNVTVRDLAADQSVCLVRLAAYLGAHFTLEDDAGLVWIEGCRRNDDCPNCGTQSWPGLAVSDCDRVVVVRSRFVGGQEDTGLRVEDVMAPASTVVAHDSIFLGGAGGCVSTFGILSCWDGGPGVVTDVGAAAQVFLTGCTVRGGDGAYWFDILTGQSDCSAGGTGVNASGPVAALDSLVEGGAGGINGTTPCAPSGANHVGAFQELAGESLAFSTGPLAREGAELVFAFRGAPHAEVWLVGSPFARLEERPTQHGFLLLGTPRALEYMGRTDASGALDVPVPIGNLAPTWDVRRTFLQPLMIEGALGGGAGKLRGRASRVTLGAGSAFLVLDSSF